MYNDISNTLFELDEAQFINWVRSHFDISDVFRGDLLDAAIEVTLDRGYIQPHKGQQ